MADKVTCPYCGAEMERCDCIEPLFYECPRCRATSPKTPRGLWGEKRDWVTATNLALRRSGPSTYGQLAKALCGNEFASIDELLAAVDQLKARAAPENRVLTLEEVKHICDDGTLTHLWIEHKDTVCHFSCYREVEFIKNKRMKISDFIDGYGKEIRCWLRKPTDDERKAVKWDD